MDNLKRVENSEDVGPLMAKIGRDARAAAHSLALASTETKNHALRAAAAASRTNADKIRAANAQDFAAALLA